MPETKEEEEEDKPVSEPRLEPVPYYKLVSFPAGIIYEAEKDPRSRISSATLSAAKASIWEIKNTRGVSHAVLRSFRFLYRHSLLKVQAAFPRISFAL